MSYKYAHVHMYIQCAVYCMYIVENIPLGRSKYPGVRLHISKDMSELLSDPERHDWVSNLERHA
jgi:hypothetical protein